MLLIATPVASIPAVAADAALEEVTVTATRREQNSQDVPLSLVVASGKQLREAGIRDFNDFAESVPSLSFNAVGPGQSQINMRGIASNPSNRDDPNNNKGSVGVYLDDVPLSVVLTTPDVDVFDLARVEVLRGPQGTLFGAGSLSGTVRFITNQPVREFQGALETGLSQTQDGGFGWEAKGMVNVPLADTLAFRSVVTYQDGGGYIDSFFDNGQHRNDVNWLRKVAVRAALAWTPTDQLTITPRVLFQTDKTGGSSLDDFYSRNSDSTPGVFDPAAAGFVGQPVGDDLQQFRQNEEGIDSRFRLADLNITYDFGPVKLFSTTSYIRRDADALRDFQFFFSEFGTLPPFSTLGIARLSTDPPRGISSVLTDTNSIESTTQEVRLMSNSSGPLQWVVGAFALRQTADYAQILRAPGFGSVFRPGLAALFGVPTSSVQGIIDSLGLGTPDAPAVTLQSLDMRQFAAFSEVTYDLTSTLSATAGVRYFDFREDKDFTFGGFLQGQIDKGSPRYKEDGVNPRFIMSFRPGEQVLLSAQASRGFRPGGTNELLNPLCAPDLAALGLSLTSGLAVQSDKVQDYELNAKTRTADGRVSANVSVFRMKYEDLQAPLRLACGQSIRQNVGDATSDGVEVELQAQPTPSWYLSLSGSYIDATLDSAPPAFPGKKGDRLPQSPKFMLSGIVRYSQPVFSGRYQGYLQGSVRSVGEKVAFFYDQVSYEPAGNTLPSYTLGNIRTGLASDKWDASLWVDNVTDEHAELTIESEFRLSRRAFARNRPRTVGVTFNYNF